MDKVLSCGVGQLPSAILYWAFNNFLRLIFLPCALCLRCLSHLWWFFFGPCGDSIRNKRIVIVGGGFAGTRSAQQLQKICKNVTLVDTKNYFEFTPSVLRTLVEPSHVSSIQVHHNAYLHSAEVVRGQVERLDTLHQLVHVKLDASDVSSTNSLDREIPYDYLLLTTGSCYSQPFKDTHPNLVMSIRAADLLKYAEKVKNYDSVVLIGGGSVGVELAAEIVVKYPHKEVVLVHSGTSLLPRCNTAAGKYSEDFLSKHNCKIIFGERVMLDSMQNNENGKARLVAMRTDKGRLLETDVVFLCTGMWANATYTQGTDLPVDSRGFVLVNEHLQVLNHTNIFVAGDIVSRDEEKLAQAAQHHADIAVHNIISHSSNDRMQSFHRKNYPVIVSLGVYDAVFTYGEYSFGGILPAMLKRMVEWKVLLPYF